MILLLLMLLPVVVSRGKSREHFASLIPGVSKPDHCWGCWDVVGTDMDFYCI